MIRFRHPRHPMFALIAGSLVLCASGGGCATAASERTVLQAEDLAVAASVFDKNEIVDKMTFVDTQGLDAIAVQSLLHRTPYKRPSFLETYQSNGVRAVDAIMSASTRFRLNPLLFLVRLEMAQGLLGEPYYPYPPARVEYVFGCGCPSAGTCDPSQAGLDRQIDCLGRALRTSLDQITASGATVGKWGPGIESITLDGQTVKPVDDSTAALYQYAPTVGTGKSGNWLFWNIWQSYAKALDYQSPIGAPFNPGNGGATMGWVGDACLTDVNCGGYPNGQCASGDAYPGGFCTSPCTTLCPQDPARVPTFCADLGSGIGYCLPLCDPAAATCRPDYKCVTDVAKFGDATSPTANVCFNPRS